MLHDIEQPIKKNLKIDILYLKKERLRREERRKVKFEIFKKMVKFKDFVLRSSNILGLLFLRKFPKKKKNCNTLLFG